MFVYNLKRLSRFTQIMVVLLFTVLFNTCSSHTGAQSKEIKPSPEKPTIIMKKGKVYRIMPSKISQIDSITICYDRMHPHSYAGWQPGYWEYRMVIKDTSILDSIRCVVDSVSLVYHWGDIVSPDYALLLHRQPEADSLVINYDDDRVHMNGKWVFHDVFIKKRILQYLMADSLWKIEMAHEPDYPDIIF